MNAPAGIVLLLALQAGAALAAPPWSLSSGAAVSVEHNSNVANAPFAEDVHGDSFARAEATAAAALRFDRDDALVFAAAATAAVYDRFRGLDHAALALTSTLRHKFGLGAFAPAVSATASLERHEYREPTRTGWTGVVTIAASQRFDERLRASIELAHRKSLTDHDDPTVPFLSGAPFDLVNRSVRAYFEYTLNDAWTAVAGYTRRTGDVVATTHRNLAIFAASSAIAVDPVFGPDAYAYRLRGTSNLYDIAASRALGARSSLNFGWERWITHGSADLKYFTTVIRVAYVHDF